MVTVVPAPSLSVDDAARAEFEARMRVRMQQNAYAQIRRGREEIATTRARSEWGLAILEFIEATVAHAEARDRRDPAWAAMTADGKSMFGTATPGHVPCDKAWREYQEARRTGNITKIEAARAAWRDELVSWFQALAIRSATEDQRHLAKLRGQLDDGDRPLRDHQNEEDESDPIEDLPPVSSRVEELVRASLERERQEAIRLAEERYQDGLQGLQGWRPAGQ